MTRPTTPPGSTTSTSNPRSTVSRPVQGGRARSRPAHRHHLRGAVPSSSSWQVVGPRFARSSRAETVTPRGTRLNPAPLALTRPANVVTHRGTSQRHRLRWTRRYLVFGMDRTACIGRLESTATHEVTTIMNGAEHDTSRHTPGAPRGTMSCCSASQPWQLASGSPERSPTTLCAEGNYERCTWANGRSSSAPPSRRSSPRQEPVSRLTFSRHGGQIPRPARSWDAGVHARRA